MSPEEKFKIQTGALHYLDLENKEEITAYLGGQKWLLPAERLVDVQLAGEGNMNLTLRLKTNRCSYILKQSRPWVAKYPQVAAPIERILTEATFLQVIGKDPLLASRSPELLQLDRDNYVLLMEDLGAGSDLTKWYAQEQLIDNGRLLDLLSYLSALHRIEVENFPDNLPLRRLNHEHLFSFPYLEASATGFDLETVMPGLTAAAVSIRQDRQLRAQVEEVGRSYLSKGPCLLHGDYYPGSWLEVTGRCYVIDPEFAFMGPPEYDLGVLLAHLHFSRATEEQIALVWEHYEVPATFSRELSLKFAGVELIRRLIGLAQLPLDADLAQRVAWLELGRKMLVG
ncbi:MAG: phosphotransferase [Bacteroidota bacterium]